MFKRCDEFAGGCLQGYVNAAPVRIKEIFGEPDASDEYKVSGEYCFRRESNGEMVTLYDWKCTSLYDDCYESPEEFWVKEDTVRFHIGGNNEKLAGIFGQWVTEQMK